MYLYFLCFVLQLPQAAVAVQISRTFQTRNYVLLAGFPSSNIFDALHTFSAIRHYHTGTEHKRRLESYPRIVLAGIVATSVNASLIGFDAVSWDKNQLNMPQIKFCTSSQVSTRIDSTALYNWRQYYTTVSNHQNHLLELPNFVLLHPVLENFIYTDLSRKLKSSMWNFALFTKPLQYSVRITLTLTGLLLGLSVSIVSPGTLKDSFWAVLSFTFHLNEPSLRKIVTYFLPWILGCMILEIFYSGEMASELIKPTPDVTLESLNELKDHNFTLIFEAKNISRKLFNAVHATWSDASQVSETVYWFMERASLSRNRTYVEILAFQENTFGLQLWHQAFHLCRILNDYIMTMTMKTGMERLRKCHTGKELLPVSNQFVTILPPRNKELTAAYQVLIECGIYQRWEQESDGMMHSKRVQDRVRIISSRKEATDKDVISPIWLKMKGNILAVFMLWATGLLLSAVLISCEHLCGGKIYKWILELFDTILSLIMQGKNDSSRVLILTTNTALFI